MKHLSRKAAFGCAFAVVCLTGSSGAQTPPAAAPTYITIPVEITVNRPAAEVWKRVGKFCDVSEWMTFLRSRPPCTITSGRDGEIGAVRSIGGEVLVGKSELSYTYAQTARPGQAYNLYHGTVEARPVTATTSRLIYTLMYDNSMLPDEAAREKDRAQRAAQFTDALQNMKILAEGGTLPPPR